MLIVELMNEVLLLQLVLVELLVVQSQHFPLLLPLVSSLGADLVDEVLLVEFEGALGADALELPPVILVQLVDLVDLLGPLDEVAVGVLLRFEDADDEIDPRPYFPNIIQTWRNSRVIHHMEYLEHERHHHHLVRVVDVGADIGEHLLEDRKEDRSQPPDVPGLLVDVVEVGTAQLLEAPEADELKTDVVVLQAFADVVLAFWPVVLLTTVRLADIVEDVLEL